MSELSDRTVQDLRKWVELRVDEAKLGVVEGTSNVIGRALGLVVALVFLNLALVVFTGVFIYLIQLLTHSWVWAAVIVGFVYLILAAVFVLRPRMFQNMMVGVLAPVFFQCKNDDDDEDEFCR